MLLAALTTFTFIFGSNFVVCRLQFVHVWHFLQKDEKEEQKKRFVSLNAQSETLSYSMRCIAHRHSRSGVTNILVHNFIINFTSHEQTLDLHIHYLFNWLRVTKIGLTILFVYAFSFLSAFAAPYACVCEPARAHTRPVLFINFYVPGFAHVLFQRFFSIRISTSVYFMVFFLRYVEAYEFRLVLFLHALWLLLLAAFFAGGYDDAYCMRTIQVLFFTPLLNSTELSPNRNALALAVCKCNSIWLVNFKIH